LRCHNYLHWQATNPVNARTVSLPLVTSAVKAQEFGSCTSGVVSAPCVRGSNSVCQSGFFFVVNASNNNTKPARSKYANSPRHISSGTLQAKVDLSRHAARRFIIAL
jgi:hypothetical protein